MTLEDLLEELVGDIQDEYDTEEAPVRVIGPETSLVDARLGIDDLNEQMGLSLPHEDFDTIGGFVFGLFGHQPVRGERVRHDGLEFVIEKTDGRRVQQIRLTRLPPNGGRKRNESRQAYKPKKIALKKFFKNRRFIRNSLG